MNVWKKIVQSISNLKLERDRLYRITGLVRKETYQIIRDPSSIIIAFIFPVMLLFLFGYGVSLDLKNINIGIVIEQQTSEVDSLVQAFQSSKYFKVILARDRREVEDLLIGGRLSAVLVIPADFTRQFHRGEKSPVQLLVRGTDANTAELVLNHIKGTLNSWLIQESLQQGVKQPSLPVRIEPRIWFNADAESRATLLPGSIAVIMALIGTMLTSLVIAREWERGTMEALLSTPLTRTDILIGKFIPYFLLGMSAMGLVTGISTLLMGIPFEGSFWLLALVSAIFLCFALGLGLLISSVTHNQFEATQVALIVGFLPSFLLSGLVFELNSMPWPIRYLTYLFPPRYFVSSLRTLFLAGNIWKVLVPDMLSMAVFAVLTLTLAVRKLKTQLE